MSYYNGMYGSLQPSQSQGNKFIYVKQNLLNNQPPPTNTASMKILVNPNFKAANVHINPNFNKPVIVPPKPNIHVNPNMLKHKSSILQENRKCYVNPNVLTGTSMSSQLSVFSKPTNLKNDVKNPVSPIKKTIVFTRTKIVKVPDVRSLKKVNKVCTQQVVKRKKAVYSKYKIVKSQDMIDKNKAILPNSKYKVDKRPLNIQAKHKMKIYNKIILNRSISLLKQRWKLPKNSYLNISGVVYKKSPNSLKRSTSFEQKSKENKPNKTPNSKNKKILTISGVKYKLNTNHKTLKLLTPKANSSSVNSVKPLQPNEIHKIVLRNKKTLLLRQTKVQRNPAKMKKCNMPCLFYRKFGRCRGNERGTCNKVHNPDQIIICPRFLQGACINKTCLLSHKVSAEKMPTCKFFLEGLCSKEDCPYSHVKISPKADICQDFLRGFCKRAKECDKRHQYLCPEFEKTGKCAKRKCPYPHGNSVRKGTLPKKPKLSINKLNSKSAVKFKRQNSTLKRSDKSQNQTEKNINVRYYADSFEKRDKPEGSDLAAKEIVANDNIKIESRLLVKDRPQLGSLPSFIPLHENKS